MASSIVPGNIDGTYPVAGQDNSSQGFRDNFTAIKNNFTDAKSEIEDLQNNKASTNAATSFNDNVVSRATFKDTAQTVFPISTGGNITLDYEKGHYQTLTTSAPVTLDFSNEPASGTVGRIVLDITVASTSHAITFPSECKLADNVAGSDGSSITITLPESGRHLWEFVILNGGTTILVHQLGKMYGEK